MRVDPDFLSGLVGPLNSITASEQKLTQQMSSGSRLTQLSDDSVSVSLAARLQSQITANDTFASVATAAGEKMQAMDTALSGVVQQMTSVISLATQAVNGTQNSTDQASIVQQLTGIRDSVVAAANTTYLGQYVFGGSVTGSAPYAPDGSYSGDADVQQITTPSGQTLSLGIAGSSVFGGSGGVIAALNNAIAGAAAGDTSVVASLTSALGTLTGQRASLDSSLKQLQDAGTQATNVKTNLQVAQSTLVASDPTQIATDLSSAETQQQALLSIMAALGKSDLFDYL